MSTTEATRDNWRYFVDGVDVTDAINACVAASPPLTEQQKDLIRTLATGARANQPAVNRRKRSAA